MNRRGFLKKFGVGVAAATVAPVVIPQILEKISPAAVKSTISTKAFESFRYGGRTYHYVKGMDDALLRHRADMEYALLFGSREHQEMKMAFPQPDGIIKYLKFKTK